MKREQPSRRPWHESEDISPADWEKFVNETLVWQDAFVKNHRVGEHYKQFAKLAGSLFCCDAIIAKISEKGRAVILPVEILDSE